MQIEYISLVKSILKESGVSEVHLLYAPSPEIKTGGAEIGC